MVANWGGLGILWLVGLLFFNFYYFMMDSKDLKVCGLFLLRVVVGVVFLAHGWQKIQGMEGTIGFFASLGLAPFFAYLVAWTEFLAGSAVLLGVFTRVAGYLLALVMVFAIFLVKFKMGFLGGYETDLILLVAALAVAFSGAGPYSLSGKVCGCGSCGFCGMKLMGMGKKDAGAEV
jgi:putative oxidoreductase